MREKMKKIKLEYWIMAFFILQPFIDIYKTFFADTISVCGFALEEIINIMFVAVIFIMVVIKMIKEKLKFKQWIGYIIYCIILGIYLILHCLNTIKFNGQVYELANTNFISEAYSVVRLYIMPLLLAFAIYNSNINSKQFRRMIGIVVLTFSSIIIITNILKISFISYSKDYSFIKGNIFSWFGIDSIENITTYTSRGWFNLANEIGALLFAMAPIMISYAIKENKIKNYILVFLQALAMLMLGTKIAALGIILVLVVMIFSTLFLFIVKLDRRIKLYISIPSLILIMLIGMIFYSVSPTKRKNSSEKKDRIQLANNVLTDEEKQKNLGEIEKFKGDGDNDFEIYVRDNMKEHYLSEEYLQIYPVNNDKDFWMEIMCRDIILNVDNRNFKIEMVNRIIENNSNSLDKFLGIGFTTNVPYTERDYYYQYFIYGAVGALLLIGPYILLTIYAGIKTLMKNKKYFNIETTGLIVALGCYFGTAYYAGHVFGKLINMYFMALYIAMLLKTVNDKMKE
ncbi:MAG: O-antigen ligase family protein [Clostridia bacterium]|nr:O-antigen ligase family protein [Clostridia bacterium]